MKEMHELTPAEKWEQATLADNFIFCKVMTANPDLCKELLELLLNIKIERIEIPVAERSFKVDYDSKGIRFDVYVKDGTGRCFDIEIQTTNRTNLAKRARYYQGLMDVDSLVSGADYSELNESYVIFLCMEDAFGNGLPVYDFHQVCKQNSDILFNDGTHKVFFNASKYDKMPTESLREFFKFLNGLNAASDFTDQLEQKVRYAKANAQWRHKFMTWEQEMRIQVKEKSEQLAKEMAKDLAKEMFEDRVNAMRADIEKEAKEMANEIAEDRVNVIRKDMEKEAKEMAKSMATEMAEKMVEEKTAAIAEEQAAEKVEETAKNMLAEKIAPEVVARCTGLSLEQVKKLASEA
ncbi:Rpn family recombination-promoting nuclease/putative transposase [uncultured Treponema sp.]|uniref:Rpn family recombination-promoting nuclease/putative transposase n=1 Tax=uncultured Treponema sp. TaxID=162155 RepID=UPI0025F2230F|nr:Rpn family recombination-promoting nuclease/putative transposase [uncultured Treponema sp.]